MNKKFITIMLAAIMCALSACALIDTPGENGSSAFDADYLVGMFVYIEDFDVSQGNVAIFPTDNLLDEKSVSLYHARATDEHGNTYSTFNASNYFTDVYLHITNGGTKINEKAPNGKIEVSATLMYTYELLGSTLVVNSVYEKSNQTDFYAERGTSYLLNNIGLSSVSSEQNLTASETMPDGTVTEYKYDGKWSLNIKFSDYLLSARLVEFDEKHNIIKSSGIDLKSGDYINYTAMKNCAYIFIEEDYEVKHSSQHYKYPLGTVYTERFLINKSESAQNHSFKKPAGNGFIDYIGVKIEF